MTDSFQNISKNIRAGKLAPVYFLHGEEGLYSDILVSMFENYLPPEERAFNLFMLYAVERTPDDVMDVAKRYPLMADKIIVIVKEAQSAKNGAGRWINKLAQYAANPSPNTVLVVVARGTKVACKEFTDALNKSGGVIFESPKAKEENLPTIINDFIKSAGLNIESRAIGMIAENIGNDLSRIYNEINKLKMILPQGATVTPEVIERNIGISREYNNGELNRAIAGRDVAKALKIIRYFNSNQRDNPWVMTLGYIFSMFSKALCAYYSDRTDAGIAAAIGTRYSPAIDECKLCMHNYSPSQIIEIIRLIRQADNFSKGNGSRMDTGSIMENLIQSIFLATGKLN